MDCSLVQTPYLLKFNVEEFEGLDIAQYYVTVRLRKERQNTYHSSFLHSSNTFDSSAYLTADLSKSSFYPSNGQTAPQSIPRPLSKTSSVIFKLNDDVRQDQFAIQLMKLFQNVFNKTNLPLALRPYHVIPHRVLPNETFNNTGIENKGKIRGLLGGMIEVIPNAISRHQLGKTMECSLSQYFAIRYGGRYAYTGPDRILKMLEDKMDQLDNKIDDGNYERDSMSAVNEADFRERLSIGNSGSGLILPRHLPRLEGKQNSVIIADISAIDSQLHEKRFESSEDKGYRRYSAAQWEFLRSLAAYSLASFLLQVGTILQLAFNSDRLEIVYNACMNICRNICRNTCRNVFWVI